MSRLVVSIVLMLFLAALSICQACNSTHLEYFSEYYLGRQDQLNKTFIKIQQKISTLNSTTWKLNDSAIYTIAGIKPVFHYVDTRQRAEITGNDTVVIDGGRVFVTMEFEWSRQGLPSSKGTGVAIANSDDIAFVMHLEVKNGFLLQTLDSYNPVTFSHYGINITRIMPADTSDEDLKNLKRLLNDVLNVTTVRHELEDQIEKYFYYYLSQSLYDDRRIIDSHFDYEWNSTVKGKLVISYNFNATGVDIEENGITLKYLATIKDAKNYTCKHYAPSFPLNPMVFGGVQEFITFDVYENTIRYAIDAGHLDTDLNRNNWESNFFQFYAGDLYEIIPKVAEKFRANEVVSGNCRTTSNGLSIGKTLPERHTEFNVTMLYNCEINLLREKISEFQLNLTLIIEGRATENRLNFYVNQTDYTVKLIPYLEYKIQNEELARHMIRHSVNRLVGHKTFGSGWNLYQRDYPHFIVQSNYTIVYDATHVDPDTVTLTE